jgi:hypothetical protein
MRRLRFRLLATLLAIPAAFATPGVSVAHGVGHAESRNHDEEHALTGRALAELAQHGDVTLVSESSGHDDDHQHPALVAGVSGKLDSGAFLLTAARFELLLPQSVSNPRTLFARTRVKAHGAHAPPPNLRGPPIIIG